MAFIMEYHRLILLCRIGNPVSPGYKMLIADVVAKHTISCERIKYISIKYTVA